MKDFLSLTIPGTSGREIEILPPENSNIPTLAPDGPTSVGGILGWIVTLILVGMIFLALGYILYGGYNWITSQGDKQKVEKARNTLVYALIGLLLSLFSILIVNFIGKLIGANFL